MSSPPRSIYRQEALDYRLHRREQSPTSVPTRFRRLKGGLWIALVVAMSAAAAAFLAPVATMTSALAVSPATPLGDGYVAVLFDPNDAAGVVPGALVTIDPLDAPGSRSGRVVTVQPDTVDPAWIERRLGLPQAVTVSLPPLLGLAWVEITGGSELTPGEYANASVESRDVRAGSAIPVLGRWFGGQS